MQHIYVEEHLTNHPRVKEILSRFNNKTVITCQHYGEVFNRKNQNFRQQKHNPALILAEKKGQKVLPTPEGFGINDHRNYYFSHLLNCPFDCRYCFLQGLYRSAHYVLFVNYEDFISEIENTVSASDTPCVFFSGYDADSLAYDPVTRFADTFIPFFSQQPNAILELRTKSANVKPLLKHKPTSNIVLAFSLTPHDISTAVEHKVPPLNKRLLAMQSAAEQGYRIGLRLDPLIYADHFDMLYRQLINDVFHHIQAKHVHSVSIGPLRFPKKMHDTIKKWHPSDPLINQNFDVINGITSYDNDRQRTMESTVRKLLSPYITSNIIFSCINESTEG